MYNRTLPDYDFDKSSKTEKRNSNNGVNLLELDDDEWNNINPDSNPKHRRKNGRRK